jgi:hypothetical protein
MYEARVEGEQSLLQCLLGGQLIALPDMAGLCLVLPPLLFLRLQ